MPNIPSNIINNKIWGFSFLLLIYLTIVIVILVWPALLLLINSIYNEGFNFSGYHELLISQDLVSSIRLTIIYSFTTVFFQLSLGILAATLVYYIRNKIVRFILFLIYFLPYAVPSIIVFQMWSLITKPEGLYSQALYRIISLDPNYLTGEGIFLRLIIVSVWQFFPFVFVTVLVRMRRIPRSYYRSAQIDGANSIKQFIYITLPQIKSLIVIIIGLRLLFMFTKFDTAYLFGGNTVLRKEVMTLPILIFERGADALQLTGNQGIAAAVILAGSMALALATVLLINKLKVKYVSE